jgi:hypothetical protein
LSHDELASLTPLRNHRRHAFERAIDAARWR